MNEVQLKITGDTKDARDEVRRFKQFLHEEFAEVTKDAAHTFGGMETDAKKSFSSVEATARQDLSRVEQRSRQSATTITRNLHAVSGNFHKSFVTQFDDAFKRGETRAHQFEQRLKSNFKSIIAAIPGGSIAASGAGFLSSLTGGGGGGGGALGVLGGVLGGNLLTGALSKLGSGLKSEVTTAFDFLDLQERSKIAFTTIFKNAGLSAEDAAKKAKSHLKDLIDFGAKTPFRAEQLIELSQRLQAVGYKAEEIIPALTSVGDAVAGLGGSPEKLNTIVDALAKIKTTGRVGGEEIESLSKAGINVLKYMTEYGGKSVEEIRKLSEKGQLDSEVASKVILAGMERDFKAMMKSTEGTYSSMWSTIEDLNQQRAAEAFEPAFEQVKRGMAGAIGGLSSSAAKNFTTGAAGMQKAVLGSFDGILSSLATGDFQGLGFGAIEGVTKGAKDAAGGLYREGADAGGQLEQGWRDRMEQHSPSAVMTRLGYAAGLSLVAGFVQGARAENVAAGLEDFLNDPRVKAFLEVIRKSEGADYHTLVGGSRIKDLSKHPNIVGLVTKAGPSTAFGAYQITGTTNKSKLAALHGLDYSPHNQDLRAVELLRQSGALTELLTDNFVGALKKAGAEWASLPGSTLPGRKRPMDFVTKIYTGANETPRTSSGALEMSRMSTGQQWNALLQIPEFRKWFQSTYGAGRTDIPGLKDLPSSAGEFLPGARSGKQALTLTPAMMAKIEALGFGTDGAAALPIDSGINLAGLLAAVPDIKLDGLKASIIDTKRTQYEFLKSLADIAPTTEEATGKAGNAVEKLGSLIKKTQDDHGYFSGANRYARPKPKPGGEDGADDGDVGKKATAAQQATASLHATIKDVKSMGREAFGEFAQGIGTTVEQFILLGQTGPDALRKVTAQTLASLSREATVKSLMALADGFVHLFTNPAQSAADFTAAAIYGSIAVASGIAGRKVAGDVFSKEQNGGASSGARGSSSSGTNNGNAPEYKFNYGGQAAFASSEAAGTGARATADAINRLAVAQAQTAAELSRIRSLPAEQVVTMGAMGARAALGEASVAYGHENDGHNAIRYRQIVGGG